MQRRRWATPSACGTTDQPALSCHQMQGQPPSRSRSVFPLLYYQFILTKRSYRSPSQRTHRPSQPQRQTPAATQRKATAPITAAPNARTILPHGRRVVQRPWTIVQFPCALLRRFRCLDLLLPSLCRTRCPAPCRFPFCCHGRRRSKASLRLPTLASLVASTSRRNNLRRTRRCARRMETKCGSLAGCW